MAKNVSNAFKNVIKNGGPFYSYARMVLADGTEIILDSSNSFMDSDNGYSEQSDSGFPLGSALSKSINLKIDAHIAVEEVLKDTNSENITDHANENVKTYIDQVIKDLYMARITLYTEADLPDGRKERIQEGIFTVIDAVYPGDVIEVTAYDDMYKADQIFSANVTYPISAQMLLNEVCNYCDIPNGSPTFLNDDFMITKKPEEKTGRQMFGYIAQIAAGNAVISPQGRLIIKSYNANFPSSDQPYAGEIESESGIHIISSYTEDPTIGVDDVVITGIATTIESDNPDAEDGYYINGTEDYAIKINNPLIAGNENAAVDMIAQSIVGIRIRPFSGSFMPDPTIEFMDLAYLIDKKDNVYQTLITSHNFDYLGKSTLECGAESPLKYGDYYSEASEVYQKFKDSLQNNKTQWEQAIENLTQQVANASGFYTTTEEQDDGSIIFYLHNKPTLEESNYVWKMTSETLSVSTDGGEHWNGGITVNGEVIATIMNTIGLNFDWGVGGTLIIEDPEGNQTLYADAETGEVRIEATSFKLKGKDIEDYITEKQGAAVPSLTRDFIGIPTDSQGNNGNYDNAEVSIKIYVDGKDYTSNISVSVEKSSNITGTASNSNKTYKISNMTSDSGWIRFSFTYNNIRYSKDCQVTKIKQGESSSVSSYFVELNTNVVNLYNGVFSPNRITAFAYSQSGETREPYFGNFDIYASTDGSSYSTVKRVSNVQSTYYKFSEADENYTFFRVELYTSDGETLLDSQNVSVLRQPKGNNLLKDTENFTTEYWQISGSFSRNLEAPDGTKTMASLKATNSDCYLSAHSVNNKPITVPGNYTFSVYLRASSNMSIQISLNHTDGTIKEIDVTTEWKCYTLFCEVKDITDQNQVTIGGWGSFSSSSGATLYVWNPIVNRIMSTEDMFNVLTNNGQVQGIFFENGQLYINGSYIKSGYIEGDLIRGGTLILGGSSNTYGTLEVRDSSGNVIGTWSRNGIVAENATITGVINGTSGHIGNWTFTENGITSNVKFNELTGGDSGLIEQSTKVKYQVQLLKYGVTEVNGKYIAMIIRTRAGSSTSSFLQRFAVAYDGTVTVGVPSGENIQITTDGQIQFKNRTTTRAYIDMSNSSTLRIHATNIKLDGNVIEPL